MWLADVGLWKVLCCWHVCRVPGRFGMARMDKGGAHLAGLGLPS